MAATYKPVEAFDYAKRYIKSMRFEDSGARALDDVQKIIWMSGLWRWSIATLPVVTLSSNTSDYTIVDPGNLLYIVDAYTVDANGENIRHLSPVASIHSSLGTINQPNLIALPNATTIRVSPKPGTISGPALSLITTYKKVAPIITNQNMHTAGVLVMDDEWHFVYDSGVLWMAYLFGDDQRAGSAQYDSASGRYSFTGQRAVFEANIQMMREREPLFLMDPKMAPEQSKR